MSDLFVSLAASVGSRLIEAVSLSWTGDAQLNPANLGGSKPIAGVVAPITVSLFTTPDLSNVIIGIVVLVVLTVGYFFLQRLMVDGLIARSAKIDKSRFAGVALFLMLTVLTASVIAAFLVSLWGNLVAFSGLISMNVALIVLALWSYLSARKSVFH